MTNNSKPLTVAAQAVGSLSEIRMQISDIQAEIAAVHAAPLPVGIIADGIRRSIGDLTAAKTETETRLDGIFANSTGHIPTIIASAHTADALAKLAVSLVLAEVGEKLIAEAVARAEIDDLATGRVRLDPIEKAERLAGLSAALYDAELAEEAIVTATLGESRRPDANAAAVLGIPADVAARHAFFINVE